MPRKQFIRGMFDNIAGDYDKLNHLMSLGVDKIWRRRALKYILDTQVVEGGCQQVLDLACGTGDFSLAIADTARRRGLPVKVHGADLSEGMLEVMREKVLAHGLTDLVTTEVQDGESLTYPDCSFDRVTIAYGIRNFENRSAGLKEMYRVLKPGGRLVVEELSMPENKALRALYGLYFKKLMPLVGGAISGDKAAYRYLPASVEAFPGKDAFLGELAAAGFSPCTHKALTLGICRLYIAEKPAV